MTTLPHWECNAKGSTPPPTYCGGMDESPKRTRKEMIAQLVVILLLMAVLVGVIFVLHSYVTSHSSAPAITSVSWPNAHQLLGA